MSVENLLSIYAQGTDTEREQAHWYHTAHDECRAAAAAAGVPFKNFVWAVAALSPNTAWGVNVKAAYEVATTGTTCYGYPDNKVKAAKIFAGDLDALRGPKVSSFARNILNPRRYCDNVTVDTWAWRAWAGVTAGEPPALRGNRYKVIEADYREAAAAVGLRPAQFQAVVWVIIRRLGGYTR